MLRKRVRVRKGAKKEGQGEEGCYESARMKGATVCGGKSE